MARPRPAALLLAALVLLGSAAAAGRKRKSKGGGGGGGPAAFASAVRRPAADPKALCAGAAQLAGAGRLREAEAQYRGCLGALPPRAAELRHAANNNLAGLLAQQQRFEEAERSWAEAIEHAAPEATLQARFNRARVLGMMQRLGEAEGALREALAIEPELLSMFVIKKNDPTDIGGWLEKWHAHGVEERLRTKNAVAGKAQEVLAARDETLLTERHWSIPCGEELYGKHINSETLYREVEGCTPAVCRRMAVDRFGSEEEIAKLRAIFQTGAYRDRSLISREGVHAGMSFVTVDGFATEAEGIAGVGGDEEAYELLWELRGRMRDKIKEAFNLTELHDSGALLQRQTAGFGAAARPHIDKVNVVTYDYAGLWYLTTQGLEFEGGEIAFVDGDADRLVEPRAGRFVAFTSGVENMHVARAARPVAGDGADEEGRIVLAMWFTCSEAHSAQRPPSAGWGWF